MRKVIRTKLGYCPCCNRPTIFVLLAYVNREFYRCIWCRANARERALVVELESLGKGYLSNAKVHESSPNVRQIKNIRRKCADYSFSYYNSKVALGKPLKEGGTNQNVECMTFQDNSFDVFITQDVMEHVYDPCRAFKEIERVLKPGGVHIFTTPINCFQPTRPRVQCVDGQWKNILPPVYHGAPDSDSRALATYDWGNDIISYINSSVKGSYSEIHEYTESKRNFLYGIEGCNINVIVSKKRNDL